MSEQVKHTAEPWRWQEFNDRAFGVIVIECADPTNNVAYAENEANASRIVACVNACAGIPTHKLDRCGGMAAAAMSAQNDELAGMRSERDTHKQQRDQTLSALVELRTAICAGRYEDPSYDRIYRALIDSKAIIAAVKGGD